LGNPDYFYVTGSVNTTSTSTTTFPSTTTTTSTSTSTTTTAAPVYYYYALSTCSGDPSSIEVGRSTSSSYGTAVFLISGICFQSNGITSGPSYDVDLDSYSIVSGGCDAVICTGQTTTTTTLAPGQTTTTTFSCPDPLTINDFSVSGPQSVPKGSTQNYTFTAAGSIATIPQTYTIQVTGSLTPWTPITWIISSSAQNVTRVVPVTWQGGVSSQNLVGIYGVNCGVYESLIYLQVSTT
jgi:hypothetical protein